MDHIEVKAKLLGANVLLVMKAARAVGVGFKNGLTKAEVVTLLAQHRKMFDAWNMIAKWEREEGGAAPVEAAPSGAEPAQAPAPAAPAPMAPPTPAASPAPATPSSDPIAALRALIGPAQLDPEQVKAIALQVTQESLAFFSSAQENRIRAALTEAAKALPQGTVIHLPNKPEPIKLESVQHKQFGDLLTSLQMGLNVYLVGGASSGKTYAAEQAATVLERKFYAQGAVTYAHELIGYVDAMGKYVRTQMREAFEHGGLLLLDEFDASSAEAALVVNAALANGFCAFPDGMIKRHPDFLCIVGANTDGSGATMQYSGRARLDGAFLDRFVQIEWEIDPQIETGKAKGNREWLACVRAVRQWMKERQIHDVAATVRAVDFGSTLLHAGIKREKVLAMTLKRGALVAQWTEIQKLPAVAEFLAGF